MKISQYKGLTYLTSELFNKYGIKHIFTTIQDENKVYPVDFSFANNKREEILENYKKIAEYFNVPFKNIVKSTQIHENNIVSVKSTHKGMGVASDEAFDNADGIYTIEHNIPLCIFSADCVPILIADKEKKTVMAVHAGWRGTAKNITGKAIDIFLNEFKTKKEDIICAIGPAIGQCCFEVSEDVTEELALLRDASDCFYIKDNKKHQLDLKKFNSFVIRDKGVPKENIDVCDLCTRCEEELFHSFRRDGNKSGRNAAFIML